jgi:TRAP-type C4-dicarboxylate transport system permease small subunit
MKLIHRAGVIFDKIVNYMLTAAAVLIIIDAVAVSQDVLIRKFFDFTWAPLFELITFTLLWITFLGTTAMMREQTHVRMDAITGMLKPRTLALLNTITSAACAAAAAGITYYTVRLTVYDFQTHYTMATILNPVKWPIEIIIPIGFLMLFIQLIRNAAGSYMGYKALAAGGGAVASKPAGEEPTRAF